MQILENVSTQVSRTFTLHLDAREMNVLASSLAYVEMPVTHDMRTQFWDLYTKISLANNSNDAA